MEYAIGLLVPYWLFAPYHATYYPMLGCAGVLIAWVLSNALARPQFRFVTVGFLALYILPLNQVLFRDREAVLFLSRYSPAAIVLVALLASATWERRSPRVRQILTALWGAFAVSCLTYIFFTFYYGFQVTSTANITMPGHGN